MVIMYENFDLMKEPRDQTTVNQVDIMNMFYKPKEEDFMYVSVHESAKYMIYENGSVIKSGTVIGNTFTSTGKTQLATLVGRSDGTAINNVICTVGGSDYTQAATNTTPGDGATLRVTSGTFTTAGTYTVVAGAAGSTKYNTITTNIVVGSGQSVQYVIDYVFSGIGGNFDKVCAARLGNVNSGSLNYPIGTIEVTDTLDNAYGTASTGVVTSNTLTVDTISGFALGVAKTFKGWAFNITTYDTSVYYTTGMTIPVSSSQTLNVRGVFVFG